MLQLPVMTVQLGTRVFKDVNDFEQTIRRFAGLARSKEAKLIVFPELTGLMLIPPLMAGVKSTLLRAAGRGRRKKAPILQKARGVLAGAGAGVLRANMRDQTLRWLSDPSNVTLLEEVYRGIFTRMATEARLTIVAGSCYRPRLPAGDLFNTAYVFGPNGHLLGTQDQTHPMFPAVNELSAGEELEPIQTPAGTLGILLGSDALFPETARILAYRGAEVLINPAACSGDLRAAKGRAAFLARAAENELYGVGSFLVGKNLWADKTQREPFEGRSAITGPMELVPRPDGIMAEMGESVEGTLTGSLDLTDLHRWWADGPTSLRREMRPGLYHDPLNRFYSAGQTIQGAGEARLVEQEDALASRQTPAVELPEEAESEMEVGFEEPILESLSVEDWAEPPALTDVPPHFERLRDDGSIVVGAPADDKEEDEEEDEGEVDESRLKLWD